MRKSNLIKVVKRRGMLTTVEIAAEKNKNKQRKNK